MPDNKKDNQFSKGNAETNYNKEAEDAQDRQEYQKAIEGKDTKLPLSERLEVLASSFKLKMHAGLAVYFYFPVLMLGFLFFAREINDLLWIDVGEQSVRSFMFTYTQIFFFSWIPEFIFSTPEDPYAYVSTILTFLGVGQTPDMVFLIPTAYMLFHSIASIIIMWMLVAVFDRSFLDRPSTLGEKWEYIFRKSLEKSLQTQQSISRVQKHTAAIKDVKPFVNEVKKKVTFGDKYLLTFSYYLPVYKFFFSRQDSIRANMLAGTLNKRWENHKKLKQEVESQEKFINMLTIGYLYGDTPRDAVKRSITSSLPYKFSSIKGEAFNDIEGIFKPENKPLLKRNIFILLSITVLLKNQILPPLYRYLKKHHGIVYNRTQRQFISNGRKIYEEYASTLKYFNSYEEYQLPLSLQYDYPFTDPMMDLSHKLALNINLFNNTQQSVVGYINEIDSLLPGTEDFDLPQPAFNKVFTINLKRIEDRLVEYVVQRCEIDPNISQINFKEPGILEAKSRKVIKDVIIGALVREIDLLAEPPHLKVFKHGAFVEIETPAIKINNATSNIILQQMNLTSYGLFKNELGTLNLGIINYTIDQIYASLNITNRVQSSIDTIMNEFKVYPSFDSINAFLITKQRELENLK
jgi:hypothetical protein